MLDFLYVVIILVYALLVFSFIVKEYIIGLLAGIGMMVIGIYMAIYGIGDIANFLTRGFAWINIGIGTYIFIVGSLEKIEEIM